MKKVVILSVPYCEPYLLLAPALLASCLKNQGTDAVGIDFSIAFVQEFSNEEWWPDIKNLLVLGGNSNPDITKDQLKKIYKFTKKFLTEIIDTHNPTVIGLSIFTNESLDFGTFVSYLVRRYWPGIRLIAGGKGLEVKHRDGTSLGQLWIKSGVVDTVVVGDAETVINQVITQDLLGLITAPQQTVSDLDNIPLPDWNHYDLGLYAQLAEKRDSSEVTTDPYITITASKGCVYRCTFCDVASFWPDYLYRDPEKVANEIIYHYTTTGIRRFHFTDNLINGSISKYRQMNEILSRSVGSQIRYQGSAVFRNKSAMPLSDFSLAAAAGCSKWLIGVESGSEQVRWDMGKKFTDDDIDWSVNALHNNNIQQSWLLIVGYPSETDKDFELSRKLLFRYQHLAANQMIEIGITPTFALLPNSPLVENDQLASKFGLQHNNNSLSDKFWTSTVFVDNDYPVRSKRWKELVSTAEDLGYSFHYGMPIAKWKKEVESLDRIYNETHRKVFPIYKRS